MNRLNKNFKNSQIAIDKIKDRLNNISMDSSISNSLDVKIEDVEKTELFFTNIQRDLDKITSNIQPVPSNVFYEETVFSLKESIQIVFLDINKIYSTLNNIKKNIKIQSNPKDNITNFEKIFYQFINDYQKVKDELEQVLLVNNKNYKIKKRRRNNVRHN